MIEIRRRRPSSESETQRQYCKAAMSVVVTQGPFIEMAVESFPSLSFSVSVSRWYVNHQEAGSWSLYENLLFPAVDGNYYRVPSPR